MAKFIDKDALVAEIDRRIKEYQSTGDDYWFPVIENLKSILSFIDTLEVIDPYEQCIQYDSIKAGIQAHAETYSFNIESELFNQLTKEQQVLWRKEIEQACISGGDMGYSLAKDTRYKENLEVKEVDLKKEINTQWNKFVDSEGEVEQFSKIAKHFFELGLKASIDKELVEEVYSHIDSIKDTADRMTSGNFMHNRAAIKFSANTIAKVLELMGFKAQKG